MTSSKIAVVTGATRGFGREVVLGLAERGYHIVALGRTVGALEELDDLIQQRGGSATLVPMDFTGDLNLCDALGAQLYERFGKLDLLILAAATLGPLTPLGHLDPLQAQKAMAVNYLAPYRLVRALDPLLQQAPQGQAAFITCSLGDDTLAYWGNYRASKAAFATLAATYAAETQNSTVDVISFDPGIMDTRLYNEAFPGDLAIKAPPASDAAARLLAQLA